MFQKHVHRIPLVYVIIKELFEYLHAVKPMILCDGTVEPHATPKHCRKPQASQRKKITREKRSTCMFSRDDINAAAAQTGEKRKKLMLKIIPRAML